MSGYLLFDGPNIAHAANSTPHLNVGDQPTNGVFNYLASMRRIIGGMRMLKPIVLWDGVSWRHQIFPDYKSGRNKEPETKSEIAQAENRARMKAQMPLLRRATTLLGVPQMIGLNVEADDLAALLVRRYRAAGARVLLVTADEDWMQLIQPGVGWYNPIHNKRVTHANFEEKVGFTRVIKDKEDEWVGVPSPAAFLDVKCMMGDVSDSVPGVGGIGEKGAIDLVRKFGSVQDFFNRANFEKLELPKKLADFASSDEKIEAYARNRRLMDLNHPSVPSPAPLRITKGVFDKEALRKFCQELAFKSYLTDFDDWCAPFDKEDDSVSTKAVA